MPTPTYTVEIAWSNAIANLFRIGASTIGGPDTIGGTFAYASFSDITSAVKSLSVKRGRNDDLTQVQAGECTIVLSDTDGTYNPENPASALAGLLNPMRPVRIRATHPTTATTYGVFYGFIAGIEHNPDPSRRETVITCIDLFEWMNNAKPTISAASSTTVGLAIRDILLAVGWSDSTMRSLDTGRTIPAFSASGSRSALQLIQDLMAVDRGLFYIAKDGVATYKSLWTLYRRVSSTYTFTQSLAGSLRPSTQARGIINRQQCTRTGGVAQSSDDPAGAASQRAYGFRDGPAISSDWFLTDNQANSLANWIVQSRSNPVPPTRRVSLKNDTDAKLTQQLAMELGDFVTISESVGGTSTTGLIESIAHEADMVGKVLTTSVTVSKKTATLFTIGTSAIGSADVLSY